MPGGRTLAACGGGGVTVIRGAHRAHGEGANCLSSLRFDSPFSFFFLCWVFEHGRNSVVYQIKRRI